MATLAALPSRAGTPIMPRHNVGPTYGTSGTYQARSGDLHGRELQALLATIRRVYDTLANIGEAPAAPVELAERIEDDLNYNPVLPVRTYRANVAFVSIGPMPPMKLEYFDD
jgi:hypothetical protein